MLAALAFSAVATASASAVEWLDNGAKIGVALSVVTTGLLELEDMGNGVKVHCEGRFLGTVGPGAADEITLAEPLTTEGDLIECPVTKGVAGICPVGATADVEAVHLPWKTTLLEEVGEIRDDIENSGAGVPGYTVKCEGQTDTCEGATSAKVTPLVSPVPSEFDAKSAGAACKGVLFAGEGLITGSGTIQLTEAEQELTVS